MAPTMFMKRVHAKITKSIYNFPARFFPSFYSTHIPIHLFFIQDFAANETK